MQKEKVTFPPWGWVGLACVTIFWPINWLVGGSRTMWAFFPLWTGYALVVDGLVYLRSGSSAINRSRAGFISEFLISAPAWWLFEILNRRVQNWHYIGAEGLTDLQYFLISTLNFSTVIPAVFGTAELVSTFKWIENTRINIRIPSTKNSALGFFVTGLMMLTALLLQPRYFFPFIWLSVYFIIEPVNLWMGNPGLFTFTDKRDWRPVIALFIGVLITGFFWEFWNYYSYPKWIYTVPFVSQVKLFEMPLPGYFGYLPFSLELCAITQMVNRLTGNRNADIISIFRKRFSGEVMSNRQA
ncbi:MAG: hypothetical protein GYA15_14810 [Leptolinea sp.]|jgi:hypothetical protein|nr:hypothetical protein [Leptolinea sp.]